MYIPFYSSPHLLPIDYKQAWLWRENLFDDDNKKKRKIITKCTFNEDVGANCRVFYTKSTIGQGKSTITQGKQMNGMWMSGTSLRKKRIGVI